jgi:hypothetical protein
MLTGIVITRGLYNYYVSAYYTIHYLIHRELFRFSEALKINEKYDFVASWLRLYKRERRAPIQHRRKYTPLTGYAYTTSIKDIVISTI